MPSFCLVVFLNLSQVCAEREQIMAQIEAAAREMKDKGQCDAWFEKSGSRIREVSYQLRIII